MVPPAVILRQTMNDLHTEQGVLVFNFDVEYIAARCVEEAVEHYYGDLDGEGEAYRKHAPLALSLDHNTMRWDDGEGPRGSKITLREAVRRHLVSKYPRLPIVIASEEF